MIRRDRIASGPGGGAGTSGGGWGGRSMSDKMADRGGSRKDGLGERSVMPLRLLRVFDVRSLAAPEGLARVEEV